MRVPHAERQVMHHVEEHAQPHADDREQKANVQSAERPGQPERNRYQEASKQPIQAHPPWRACPVLSNKKNTRESAEPRLRLVRQYS